MAQQNGADVPLAPDEDQPQVPFAHPPHVDLGVVLPTQGQIDESGVVPVSAPDTPQAATGQPPQTTSVSSAQMPSEVPATSTPTAEQLEHNMVKKGHGPNASAISTHATS